MGMGFAPTWLRQVRPPLHDHFNHWLGLRQSVGLNTTAAVCLSIVFCRLAKMMIRRVMYTKSSTLAIWHSCHRLAVLVHRGATSSVSAAARTVTRGVLLMTTPISNIRTIPEFDDLLHFVSDIYFDADTYCTVVYFDYRTVSIRGRDWCTVVCFLAYVQWLKWYCGPEGLKRVDSPRRQ